MQKTELCFIVQGNYGYGWEDLSGHGCGVRQHEYCKAHRLALDDLKAYNDNEYYPHRIIKRYEKLDTGNLQLELAVPIKNLCS